MLTPSPHRCLLIPEVIRLICNQLHTSAIGRSTGPLYALARTCRFFSEPALECLWSEIEGLSRLVQCMPDDLWELAEGSQIPIPQVVCADLWADADGSFLARQQRFKRAVVATDWPRFTEHARHVRVFRSFSFMDDLTAEDYQSLLLAAACTPLFPNLRKFTWSYQNSSAYPSIALFLSPNIIDIAFTCYPETRVQLSLISTLHSRYPNMENITFELPYESVSNGVNIISTALRGWHKLREVTVNQISTEAYRHLAMLPKLRSLELTLYGGRSDTQGSSLVLPAFPVKSSTFMALRILTVHCQNINFCISILADVSSNRTLTDLTLQFYRSASAAQWKALIETIKQTCPPSLSTIFFSDNNSLDFQGNMGDFTLKEEHLEPLFSFPNLESVDIRPVSVDINDDVFERITQTWPSLIFLGIRGLAHNQPPPRPTLAVLQSFAKNCPEIRLLAMRLDGTVPCTSNAKSRVFKLPLRSIVLEDSPIADPAMAAAYLSDIMPYMESIDYEGDNEEDLERQKLWAEVVRLHKVFRAVRLQEMARSRRQRKRA